MRGNRTAPCEHCGKLFTRQISRHGRFCSNSCARYASYPSPLERFWRHVLCGVTPDACWRWTGPTVSSWSEYGRIRWDGRERLAHHISHLIHVGPIPEGSVVRHRCPGGGNPGCVHPGHLMLGTMRENNLDTLADGRHWSQSAAWSPKRRVRPDGIVGEMREVVVILQRTVHRRLAAKAQERGISLQQLAAEALAAL